MKVLVTGGSGYIGSNTILEILSNTNWEVISIDNFSNSHKGIYDKIKKIVNRDFQTFNINLCNYNDLERIVKLNPDIQGIIHFAAYKSVPQSVSTPLPYYENNITSLINVIKVQKNYKIKSLIFSSSCAVYGNIKT